jgi:intracellular septation protein A
MKKENLNLLLLSFAPLIAFYGFEHFFGLKVAIGATVVVTIAEIIYRKFKKEELGAFFYFISITTIVFGLIDVYSTGTSFFKYEPALTNFVTGIYFAYGAMTPKPMMLEMGQKMKKIPEDVAPEFVSYLRVMTWLWVWYMLVKSVAYLWIAREPETSTVKMMIIRTVAGNVSMFVMLGISWLVSKPIFRWVSKKHQGL